MRLGPAVPLVFLAWPFLEVAAFAAVGREIGVLATVALVALSALAGTLLLRMQGIALVRQTLSAARRGTDPLAPIGDAALVAIAGVLLILPGFVSDAVALLLLVPPVRKALVAAVAARATVVVRTSGTGRRVVDLEPSEWRDGGPVAGRPDFGAPGPRRLDWPDQAR